MRTVDPSTWSKNKLKLGVKPTWQRAQGLEARLRTSFGDAIEEYLTHCTVKGVRHAREHRASKHFKRCYAFLVIGLLGWGTSVWCFSAYQYRTRPPLQVDVRTSSNLPTVTFPAIAICSNSVVSEKALQQYTDDLVAKANNLTYTREEIKNLVKNFGALINLIQVPYENLQFLRFLYKIDSAFNITDLMFKLGPKCSSMLLRCSWHGRPIDCKLLFADRVTPLGFCCVFNSRYHPMDVHSKPKSVRVAGQSLGLTVYVKEDMDDFAVIRRPTVGLQVLLFEGSEYPLLESGVVRSYSVGVNASAFFQLTAHAQFVADTLSGYSETWRGCRMYSSEDVRSSYPWCLTDCRKFTTLAVCNCVPFYLLPNATDTICTTEHLQCLFKHKEKLMYYYPGESDDILDSSLDEERQDSQLCTDCVPDCARLLHTAAIFQTKVYYPVKLLKGNKVSRIMANLTLMRFYYPTTNHHVYNVEINLSWFEAYAHISSQIWFLMGTSLVCVAELLFHVTFRWAHHFWRRTRQMTRVARMYS